jgi:uncharacterized membrane protein YjfL (UPF0719 family)
MMAVHAFYAYHVLAATADAAASGSDSGGLSLLIQHLIAAVLFSAMGLAVFGGALWLANRLAPFSLRKELEEDQNTAVAIIIGAIMIGISIIIAAAIHG